jgi:hypothetical protein
VTVALVLVLAIASIGPSVSGVRLIAAQTPAQPPDPCALLTSDEVHALAPKEPASNGVASSNAALESSSCRYMWGAGNAQYVLTISVDAASRMFAGMNPESIKEGLRSSVVTGTTDAIMPDVGDMAVFRAYSPVFVRASAYSKGRVLQLTLDGLDAREEKGQLISLLKSAAARL